MADAWVRIESSHADLEHITNNIHKYLDFVKREKREYGILYWHINPYRVLRKALANALSNETKPKLKESYWAELESARKRYILEAAIHDQSSEPEFAELSKVVSLERLEKVNKKLVRKRGSKTTKDDKKTSSSTSSTFDALQEEALIKLGRQV